jgi:hypothetical protein
MTTFAPHRDTLESFVDCINGGADKDILTGLLAEDVVLYGPFGDEPVTGREVAVETIKTVNGLSSDDTYLEVLSGETHHAAHFRLQVGRPASHCSATLRMSSACRPGNCAPTGSDDQGRALLRGGSASSVAFHQPLRLPALLIRH